MRLTDVEVSPDLSCAQEQGRKVADQTALTQVFSECVPSATFLNQRSGATGPQKAQFNPASAFPFPLSAANASHP